MTAIVAMTAPRTPMPYPVARPIRRPRTTIRRERRVAPSAAPSTTAAPGAPLRRAEPERSSATIVATVTAAIWPVLPRATPATSEPTVRRRSAARRLTGRSSRATCTAGAYSGPRGVVGRKSARRSSELLEPTERVREAHLLRCPGLDAQEIRGRDDDRDAPCPRGRDVEAVTAVEGVHPPWRKPGRRGRPRVEADRPLLPLVPCAGGGPG